LGDPARRGVLAMIVVESGAGSPNSRPGWSR